MSTPALNEVDKHIVYLMEDALARHSATVAAAKTEWRKATHPRLRPTQDTINAADERYRIAFNASLRVYLAAIMEVDDRRQ